MSTLTQERLTERLFREAFETFKKLLTSTEKAAAQEAWGDLADDHAGQVEILQAAKDGDITAINYLYLALIPQISSVFWNNFVGKDTRHQRRRIEQGDHLAYASMVYEVLLSASVQTGSEDDVKARMKNQSGYSDVDAEYEALMGTASPLRTFDPDVFDEDTDVIKKFGFYLIGALKNESIKYNRKERRGGLTGKRVSNDMDDAKNVSYEAHFDGAEDARTNAYSDYEDTDNDESWEQFVKDPALDSGREPTSRDVLRDFLDQEDKFDVTSVAEKYGATNQTIRNRLGGMADILQKHGIDQSAFQRMLATNGGKALAASL